MSCPKVLNFFVLFQIYDKNFYKSWFFGPHFYILRSLAVSSASEKSWEYIRRFPHPQNVHTGLQEKLEITWDCSSSLQFYLWFNTCWGLHIVYTEFRQKSQSKGQPTARILCTRLYSSISEMHKKLFKVINCYKTLYLVWNGLEEVFINIKCLGSLAMQTLG